MSGAAFIDAARFAREEGHLEGEIAVATLSRLQDVVAQPIGVVRYQVDGTIDARRKPVLDMMVETTLILTCQRCLGPMEYELRRSSRFVVAAADEVLPDIADEDPETETLPADALADIEDVVEQELVLGLPMVPTHPAGSCGMTTQRETTEHLSPFAMLEQLKRKS